MTQYIFFSGKGGVGKTTMAATTAVYQSQKGKRTLLVSTDPAGNLGDIFERKVGIETIQVTPDLFLAQMDSDAITDAYKNRMLEPLSAGQQQRVAIARALANDPDLLLADEPTGNLDPALSEEIMNILNEINQNQKTTIVMVTHSPAAANYGTVKIHLHEGRLKEQTVQEKELIA